MHIRLLAQILAVEASVLCLSAGPTISSSDFSHESAYKNPVLAPDGKAVAYAETIKGEHRIYILDLTTNKKVGMDLAGNDKWIEHSSAFFWANNSRFVFSTPITGWYVSELPSPGRYTSIKRDGRSPLTNIQGGRLLHQFRDEANGRVLMTGQDIALAEMKRVEYYIPNRPFVQEINTSMTVGIGRGVELDTISSTITARVADNPGNIVDWFVTAKGEIKAGETVDGTRYGVTYRGTPDGAWETLPGLGNNDPESFPLGFSADETLLYVGRVTPAGTWGVYPYDLRKRLLSEPILTHRYYDIIRPFFTSQTNGLDQQKLIYSPKTRVLLGIRYETEYPRVLWLDSSMGELQQALDQALPNKINTMVSFSDDLQQVTVQSWSDRDDGTYYFFDRSTQKLEKLLARRSWVDSTQLAEQRPFRFKARDGVLISGYLTIPPGGGQTNLPMIVLTHQLGWRTAWGFDGLVQLAANRGYAVLQIDPRGTSGYGERFFKLGQRQAGRGAQDDFIDATRWAIDQKIADGARVGIVGPGPMGGYLALGCAAAQPDLYKFVVDIGGVTDWSKFLDPSRIMPDYLVMYQQILGDPSIPAEAALLQENSFLVHPERIKTPLLVIHDKEDRNWMYHFSKELATSLQKLGRTVEFSDSYNEKFGYLTLGKYYDDTLAFTQKYVPTQVAK